MNAHDNQLATGQAMYRLIERLYPICRSITGDGVRETLGILQEYIQLDIHEVPTGTHVFDWTVPKEWNIRDAYIANSAGNRIVDFATSNLHVLGYSMPVHRTMGLAELKQHLFTLPDQPHRIPYLTSYYQENWGFCLTHRQYEHLPDDTYDVVIDSTLEPGHLTYGELLLPGRTDDEILLTCYVCHPSMCNDNLSGVALLTFLARHTNDMDRRYSYRFLFIPETIGAITWLARNETCVDRIKHGLVAACLGDAGHCTYKKTRHGNTDIDRAVEKVLADSGDPYRIIDFAPLGSDERQFCSPGFDLPVGSLMRTPFRQFPEYHTSADDLSFVHPEKLADSLAKYHQVLAVLEDDATYVNLNPKCEPQLGRRGLYRMVGSRADVNLDETAMLWVLNQSDGTHSLLDIAIRSGLPVPSIKAAADALRHANLLKPHHNAATGGRGSHPSRL